LEGRRYFRERKEGVGWAVAQWPDESMCCVREGGEV
jgi:hypothetical protein